VVELFVDVGLALKLDELALARLPERFGLGLCLVLTFSIA